MAHPRKLKLHTELQSQKSMEKNMSNVELVFGCLHHMEVGCVADVSEEHIAFIIRVEVRSVNQPKN
jgi:hypothetical protein